MDHMAIKFIIIMLVLLKEDMWSSNIMWLMLVCEQNPDNSTSASYAKPFQIYNLVTCVLNKENPNVFTASQWETSSKIIMAQVVCENVDNIPRITPHVAIWGRS